MPRAASPTLSRERIVSTALTMARRSGDPPGMRELAAELGVTPGALYRHVQGRPVLIELLVDTVVSQVAMPLPNDVADPWERIRIHVRSLTRVLDEYPGLDRLVAEYGDNSSAARVRQRWFVQQLRDCGLSSTEARRAYGVVTMYWLGSRQPPRRFSESFSFGLERLIDGLKQLVHRR